MDQLRRLAREEGLHFSYRGTAEPHAPAVTRLGRPAVEGIARGLLPDETAAALAVLAYPTVGADGTLRRLTMCAFLHELPEAAGRLPWLVCRSREAALPEAGGPGSLPPLRDVRTESEYFESRFRLGIGPGTDEAMVRRLFAPEFLHWFAYESPYGFSCELTPGALCAYIVDEPDRPGRLRSLWEGGTRVALQIRREAAGG